MRLKNINIYIACLSALVLLFCCPALAYDSTKISSWVSGNYTSDRDVDYGSSTNWFRSAYGSDYCSIDDVSAIIDQGQHFVLASNEYVDFDIVCSLPNWVHTVVTVDSEHTYRLYYHYTKSDLDAHKSDKYLTVWYVILPDKSVYIVNQLYLKNNSRIFNLSPTYNYYDSVNLVYSGYYQFTNNSSSGSLFSIDAGDPSVNCALRLNYSINDVEANIINFMCPIEEVENDDNLQPDEVDFYYQSAYAGDTIASSFDESVPPPTNVVMRSVDSFTFNPYQEIVSYADGSNVYLDVSIASYVDCLDVQTYSRMVSTQVGLDSADRDNIATVFSYFPGGINYDSSKTYEENFENAKNNGFYNYANNVDYHVNDYGIVGKLIPSIQSTDWTITNYYKTIYNKLTYQVFTVGKENLYVPMVHVGFKEVTAGLNSMEVFTRSISDLNQRLFQFQTIYAKQCGYSPLVKRKKCCYKLCYIVDGKRSSSMYYIKDDDLSMLCNLDDAKTFGFLPADYEEDNDLTYDTRGYSQSDVTSDIAKYIVATGGTGGSSSSSTGSVSAIGINGDVNNSSSVGDINITVPGGSSASSGASGSSSSSIPFAFSPSDGIWTNLKNGVTSGFGLLGEDGTIATLGNVFRWFDPQGIVVGVMITGIILCVVIGVINFLKP